jgi:serine/threonine-protein kinase
MPLKTGTRIGSYEIVSALGAGGMGEVFRARDTKLNRDVAIKVLPDSVATDPERLARFEREAQTLAAFNNPRIAQIYGVIELGDTPGQGAPVVALVMEFVDGEDLAQRLARGPMLVDDAFAIALQIADGLEAAHERGIVHRDLKPANVKVTPDGVVKVLDFGLAKAVGSTPDAEAISNAPTFTSPAQMTQVGTLLGTAHYIAPEQVRGKAADRRADIWAFGCVLYEMLVGRPPFYGESLADTLGAIVKDPPRWDDLPAATPPSIRRLLTRCLMKDPIRRLRDIGEARIALDDQLTGAPDAAPVATPALVLPRQRAVPWLAITSIGLALALGATALRLWRLGSTSSAPIVRYSVLPPAKSYVPLEFRPAVALSPDGSTLAFVATLDGIPRLYVRVRDSVDARVLTGTEGGSLPSFSPDGRWIAFYAEGKIKKAPLNGPPVTLASAPDVRGIAWQDEHTLIFPRGPAEPLVAMSADGGEMRPVSRLAPTERTHRWPEVLPGGKAVIFTVGSPQSPDNYDDATIEAVVLATGERRLVWRGAAMARYSRSGHLIFSRGPALYAIAFDPESLTTSGSPTQIAHPVERDVTTGAAHFACAADGTFAMVSGSAQSDGVFRLVWVDKQGVTQPLDLAPGEYHDFRISPDGTRVAMLNGQSGAGDVWIYDLARGTNTRLTFSSNNAAPVWSADGANVFYVSTEPSGTASTVYRKPADGSREAEVVAQPSGRVYLACVSKDGTDAVLDVVTTGRGMSDIIRMPLRPLAKPSLIVGDPADSYGSTVSPDAHWVAYHSDESGRQEIYVRDLTGTGGRWQVSTAGGEEPHWSKDGHELYYRVGNRMMAAAIDGGTSFHSGTPRLLFEGVYNLRSDSLRSYDVDPVTGRFLMIRPLDQGQPPSIRITLNWFDELRRLVPAP